MPLSTVMLLLDVVLFFFVSLFASRPLSLPRHASKGAPTVYEVRASASELERPSPLHAQIPRTARKLKRYERNKQSRRGGPVQLEYGIDAKLGKKKA